MINAALQFLAARLNARLRMNQSFQEDLVVVSKLFEGDGRESERSINKLNLFLVNIGSDPSVRKNVKPEFDGFRNIIPSKQVFLNLYVMVASNFKNTNYAESLKYLSKAVGFLQDHALFDRTNSPDMPIGLEKLFVDMENLSFQDLNSLWGALGGKYVPSVLYRVRAVALGDQYSYYSPYVIQVPEDAAIGIV